MNNVVSSEDVLLSSINMANLAINMPENLKLDILQKYETLASSKITSNNSVVMDNAFNYSVLMNKTLFLTLIQTRKAIDLTQYTNLNNMLQLAIKDNAGVRGVKAFNKLYNELVKDIVASGTEINQTPTASDIQTAIQTFGIEHADNINDTDIDKVDIPVDDMDLDIDTDEIFNEPELDDDDIQVGDGKIFEDEETDEDDSEDDELDEETFSLDDEDIDLDEQKEEQRKKDLKEGKVSGTANDINGTSDDNDSEREEEIEALVNNTINNIMSAYGKLYQPLFNNPPKGVMYTEESGRVGIMAVGSSETNTGVRVHSIPSIRLFIVPMYNAIKEISGSNLREAPKVGDDGMDIQASWINPDGSMKYNYAPHIQVRNCMGVYKDKKTGRLSRAKTWSEFRDKLTNELKPTIKAMLKRVDISNDAYVKAAMSSIQELYTSIILVNEFDAEKAFRLTICCQSLSNSGILSQLVDRIVASNPLTKDISDYKIMNNTIEGGVLQALVVTDIAKYRGEINFAYKTLGKIIKSGGSIDISHTIVGTDLSGNPVELNLANNAYVSMGIVAGTRSGKGVLTMSILASMIAAKCPVVYLDYKPDMAGTFWKLERKYGVKTLAIDGQTSKLGGLTPVRNYQAGYGVPAKLKDEISDKLNVMPYIKGVQIMNLIGAARVAGKIPKNHKMFFILDEAQQCSKQIADNAKAIEALRDKNKPKGKAEESEEYKYLVKLSQLFSSVGQAATTFLNTNGGLGNMGALVLGQQANATDWKGPLGALMLKCAVKFLGNGTVGGSQYGLNSKIKGVGMIGTGYFGLSTSNTPTDDNTKIIKSTLVLNDADFDVANKKGGEYTGALLKNITNEEIKNDIIENDMIVSESNDIAKAAGFAVGEANKLVGFPGLIEFIGNNSDDFNIKEALGAGYKEVEKVLKLLGIVGDEGENGECTAPYKNVESYLYSAKENSLFTSGQLNNALNSGMTIYEYLQNGAEESDDGLISDENGGEPEDSELINMGASNDTPESENSDSNGDNGEALDFGGNNTGNMSDDEAFAGMGAREAQAEPERHVEVPKFTLVKNLMSKNCSDNTLMEYFNKYELAKQLMTNSFNYNDRSHQIKKRGLLLATIYIGNYVYITQKLGLGQSDVIGNAFSNINNGRNGDYSYSFLVGMIDSLISGELQYDTMPTENQMREWQAKYIPDPTSQTNNSDNQSQTGNPIDVSNMSNNTEQHSEDIGARILRLSQQICLERHWTAEQLIEFQNLALAKMGVQ